MSRALTPKLTVERLRELLDYDPISGKLVWRVSRGGTAAGSVAGTLDADSGYIKVYVDGRNCWGHRLAWLHYHGVEAPRLDHRNMNRADNSIANLREATNSQNMFNCGKRSHNKSGYKGVSWSASTGKWWAQIKVNGVHHNLGYHDDPAVAHAAYVEAAKRLHGEFARVE